MTSETVKILINQQWLEAKKDLVLVSIRKGNAIESSQYPFFSKVGDSSYIYAQTQITWLQKFFIHYVIALLHNEKNEALDSISKSTNASPNPQEFNEDETNDTEKKLSAYVCVSAYGCNACFLRRPGGGNGDKETGTRLSFHRCRQTCL